MLLKYHWNDMNVNVPQHYGDTPHTKCEIRDIDYTYSKEIRPYDIIDYLMPIDEQDKTTAHYYMNKAIQFLLEIGNLDLESLENDDYFVEFMKDRYEKEALESWEETNEQY